MTERITPAVTDRDVYITRSFAAPIEVVWKFWTDPDLLAQWFGPHTVTVPRDSVEVDVREGGVWKLAMHDDTGVHPLTARILVAEPPTYLELTLTADTGMGDLDNVILRVQFHDHGETTRMTLHQGPFPAEFIEPTAQGWSESFEKLDTQLGGQAA
jgi:uncharacterized protein YndB with AHSA1/START domain